MKGLVIGVILGVLLVLSLLVIASFSLENSSVTGNAINVKNSASNQKVEQIILDKEQDLKENMNYAQTIEVYENSKIYIDLESDKFVNYALLPEYEVDHYLKGESYKAYANSEKILFIQNSYDLNAGKYSVIVTSLEDPVKIHLIIKAI